ncbi:hypothetical protein HFN_1460 [Helicobacter fennelliae MRY12-0050]|uniref:Uncharacterized protein n=1 Tax=Helicobacter fennelliae MRY12-0050 TaxID=1325130 RepID=T1CY73_9HELI|nr:hypothetical protein HFN_1460 [Helicobacter fennelliae MRY12-0050]
MKLNLKDLFQFTDSANFLQILKNLESQMFYSLIMTKL